MYNKPIVGIITCSKTLSANRYWEQFRCPMAGWLLARNMSTSDTIRCHWDTSGDDWAPYEEIKPLHWKPFQVDDGDDIWFSSGVAGTQIRVEVARYKPVKEEFGFTDDASVVNVAYVDPAKAITTTYNVTPTSLVAAHQLTKGYGTTFQIVCDVGGFTGNIKWSKDGGTTYSSAVPLDSGDPTKLMFSETVIFTNIIVTRTGGTYTLYYR